MSSTDLTDMLVLSRQPLPMRVSCKELLLTDTDAAWVKLALVWQPALDLWGPITACKDLTGTSGAAAVAGM